MLDTRFWKKYFQVYDILNVLIPYQELTREIINNLEIKEGDSILDLGSGTGNIALEVEKKGAIVVGIDSSEEGVRLHKKKLPKSLPIQGDITNKLPFNDNTFDKVYSNNVLYTIDINKRPFIYREIYRVLKPGGIFVISNISKEFKPIKIYLDHIKKQVKRDGVIKVIKDILKLIRPTLKMFYYNYLIKKEKKTGSYSFMKTGEQKKDLLESGFNNISKDISTYSNQAILNKGYK